MIRNKALYSFLFIFTFVVGLFFNPNATEAAAPRYAFNAKDANGKVYYVALSSANEKRTIEEDGWLGAQVGDVLYRGVYSFAVAGKKQKVAVNNNQTMQFNPKYTEVYVVPTQSKGTPDVIIVTQTEFQNIAGAEAFAIATNGELKRISFTNMYDKKVYTGVPLSNKMKTFAPTYFQTVMYDNGEAMGWYFHTYKLNPATFIMTEVSSLFYGDGDPYQSVKKGSWDQGKALLQRVNTEPTFAVTTVPLVKAPAPTPTAFKLLVDKNLPASLKAGKIQGLNLTLGTNIQQVQQVYGKINKSFNMEGALFYTFVKAPAVAITFETGNPKVQLVSTVKLIDENLPKLTLSGVKQILGTPADEGYDDMNGAFYVSYYFGNTYISFEAKTLTSYLIEARIERN